MIATKRYRRLLQSAWDALATVRAPRVTWVLMVVLVLRLPMFFDPRGPDSMHYAYVGQVVAEGGRPYIDAWYNKPPGIYLLNALALTFAPWRKEAIILLETCWILLVIHVSYLVAKTVLEVSAAKWVPVLLALSINVHYLTGSGNLTEPYGLLPMAVGYLAFFSATSSNRRSFPLLAGCGAAFALAMQFRVTFCFALLGLATGIVCLVRDPPLGRARFRYIGYLVVGFTGTSIAVAGSLLAWGVLPAYFDSVYLRGFDYVSAAHSLPFHRIVKAFVRGGPAMVFGLLGMAAALPRQANAKIKTLAVCAICDLGGALLSPHWYGHYFIQPVIPFSILTVFFLRNTFAQWLRTSQTRHADLTAVKARSCMAGALLVLSLCGTLFHQAGYVLDLCKEIADESSRLTSLRRTATYIREITTPADSIVCCGGGFISDLYFLSSRKAASRHFYTQYFGKSFGDLSEWQESVIREYLQEIRQNRPSAVVVSVSHKVYLPEPYDREFFDWLQQEYVRAKTIGGYEIWRRR